MRLNRWFRSAPGQPRPSRENVPARRPRSRTNFLPRCDALEVRRVLSGGYSFQTIDDPLGVQANAAFAINSSGQIVGGYVDAVGVSHAYLLSGGHYTTIDDPNMGTGPGSFSQATGINASGTIVGGYTDTTGAEHGFLLSGGRYTDIDDPSGVGRTLAFGINAPDQVVGAYADASGTVHGFLLSHGQYKTLDDPNAVSTIPFAINASGRVIGIYYDAASNLHGFLLSGGTYTTIDDPSGVNGTNPNGINDQGQIVGGYFDARSVLHTYVQNGSSFTTIDDPAGVQGSAANGINDAGQLVGIYYDATGYQHGYLANPTPAKPASSAALETPSGGAMLDNGPGTMGAFLGAGALAPLMLAPEGPSGEATSIVRGGLEVRAGRRDVSMNHPSDRTSRGDPGVRTVVDVRLSISRRSTAGTMQKIHPFRLGAANNRPPLGPGELFV
jgi:probable HAF family extracellular repeat protein